MRNLAVNWHIFLKEDIKGREVLKVKILSYRFASRACYRTRQTDACDRARLPWTRLLFS